MAQMSNRRRRVSKDDKAAYKLASGGLSYAEVTARQGKDQAQKLAQVAASRSK